MISLKVICVRENPSTCHPIKILLVYHGLSLYTRKKERIGYKEITEYYGGYVYIKVRRF